MRKNYYNRVSTNVVLAVKKSELNAAFEHIKADWKTHLKEAGIKLPQEGSGRWYQLALLKHFQGSAVHKDDISQYIAKQLKQSATDQQVRHLKTQGGWFILNRGDSHVVDKTEKFTPEGCHVLITTEKPLPNSTLQRRTTVGKGDWADLLEAYNNTCASCGTKIGDWHRFDSSFKVEALEKGHMNPNKPLEPGNIIPQCRWCNKTARGDFTFDEQGRPRAVASIRPVKLADPEVIQDIEKYLNKRKD